MHTGSRLSSQTEQMTFLYGTTQTEHSSHWAGFTNMLLLEIESSSALTSTTNEAPESRQKLVALLAIVVNLKMLRESVSHCPTHHGVSFTGRALLDPRERRGAC